MNTTSINIHKKRLLVIVACIAIAIIFAIVLYSRFVNAASVSGECYFSGQNNCYVANEQCGINDTFSGPRHSGPNGCYAGNAMAGINTVDEFTKFIIDRYNNGPQEKDRKTARMTILQITGDGSVDIAKFTRLMGKSGLKAEIIPNMPVYNSSYWDPDRSDLFRSPYPGGPRARDVIRIYDSNQTYAQFEIGCGNPIAWPVKIDDDYTATLTGRNSVTPAAVDVTNSSQQVTLNGTINVSNLRIKDAPFENTASYNWHMVFNGVTVAYGTELFKKSNPQVSVPYTHTFAKGTPGGDYCGQIIIDTHQPRSADSNFTVTKNQAEPICVRVTSNVIGSQPIYMESAAHGGSTPTVEPEQNNTSGRLWNSLSNTPKLQSKEWGYVEQSQQLGPYKVKESESARAAYYTATRPNSYDYGATPTTGCLVWIPDGVWNICSVPAPVTYSCPNGDQMVGPTTCRHNYTEYFWVCDDDWGARGWSEPAPSCRSQYSTAPCQDGNNYTYWNTAGSARDCTDTWRCQYGDSPLFANRGKPLCEYRCSGGRGLITDRARLSSSKEVNGFETWDGGDADRRNCYRPWQVTITCTISYLGTNWYSKDPANTIVPNGYRLISAPGAMPLVFDITVNADAGLDISSLCSKNISYYGGYVGDVACAQISTVLSPFQSNNSSYLNPNQRSTSNGLNWSTRTNPGSAQQCYQTIARPYVNFNKTDIRSTNGSINTWGTWSGSSGYGSSVGYAAYASTWIDGLRSNALNSVTSPKTRTFANSNGTWGGNFGNYNVNKFNQYVSTIGANKPCTGVPGSITVSTVINCSTSTVTIGGDIDTNWSYAAPKSLYIIADTINISGNVQNIRGVALIARTINTCYDGADNCGRVLNLKGLINSDRVNYQRAANASQGSTLYCVRPGRPGDLPGWVRQTCGPYNRGAEIINYSPEFEVSPAPYTPTNGLTSGKYDSIRSLPPVY